MLTTQVSLLERLRSADPDSPDWRTLHDIYRPFIAQWLAKNLNTCDEADDLAQEVFIVLTRELPNFRKQGEGSFRAWLRQIVVNQALAYLKKRRRRPVSGLVGSEENVIAQLADPKSALSQLWDRQHDNHFLSRVLKNVEGDFDQTTWQAFTLFTLDDMSALDVAAKLGISGNAVVKAKARVLRRLRQEASGFVD